MNETITLGNVITVIIFLIGLLVNHRANVANIAKLNFKIDLMWEDYKRRFKIKDGD